MPRSSDIRGFTVVELIVVVSLLALLASAIFAGFQEYFAIQQFRSTSVEVAAVIREARQETLAATDDETYGISVDTTSLTRFTGPTYVSGATSNVVHDLIGATLTPSLTGGTTTITFQPLTGVPSATGTILITSTLSGATTTITVTGTGIIE